MCQLELRFINMFYTMCNSENTVVSYIARNACNNFNTHLGSSVSHLVSRYGVSRQFYLSELNVLRNNIINFYSFGDNEYRKAQVVKELLDCLDGNMYIDSFNHDDLQEIINELSTE